MERSGTAPVLTPLGESEWRAFVATAPYSAPWKQKYFRSRTSDGVDVVVGYTPGEPWMDVFARKRRKGDAPGQASGPYGLYGFHSEWSRWSFGSGPTGAQEIRAILRQLVPTIRDRAS